MNSLLNNTLSTHNLEYYTYSRRAINVLSYLDESTGRLYPGIIDESKWDEEILKNAFIDDNYDGKEFGIKIILNYFDDEAKNKVLYYNEEGYEASKVFYTVDRFNYVLVKSDEDEKPAKLDISVAYHEKRYE